MAILGRITALFFDSNREEGLFPLTKTRAVSDDNGVGLDSLLETKQKKHIARTVILYAGSWSNNKQTVTLSEANGTNTIIVCSSPDNIEDYVNDGVYCSGQSGGKLTFTCVSIPTKDLKANIMIFD